MNSDDVTDGAFAPSNEATPTSASEAKPSTGRARPKANPKSRRRASPRTSRTSNSPADGGNAKYPRHSVERALRIPRAIIDQNAGKECTDRESASFAGVGFNGPFRVEISSSLKYGFLERPRSGHVTVTDRARQAIRPQNPGEEVAALRQAILDAPDISAVYKHYRGENLPDGKFLENALVDKFSIPASKVSEFLEVFLTSLKDAGLVEQQGNKYRLLDVTDSTDRDSAKPIFGKVNAKINAGDTCFVVMPFTGVIGSYYQKIYEPAIQKAGLKAIRADADIFGTGKIMDQIWSGIQSAKVLVSELTSRNPNVFYELGLAHALRKPVVLVSSNEDDVPFDLKHIRVIYYELTDPFWGEKLIGKIAENIVSAINNPEEAVFERALNIE